MIFSWIDAIVAITITSLAVFMFTATIYFRIAGSSLTKKQIQLLSIWGACTLVLNAVMILTLPFHDRNIFIIIVVGCICIWAIYIFRGGNAQTLDESPNNVAVMLLIFAATIIFYGFDFLYPIDYWSQIEERVTQFIQEFYANSGAELISIAITVIVLDHLTQRRNAKERQEELFTQMNSNNRDIAILAVQQLHARGWLEDVLDEDTILPDGTKWTPDRDIREFTQPQKWKIEQYSDADILLPTVEETFGGYRISHG